MASLLSGTSGRAPWLCRTVLSILMVLQFGSLALGAKTLWRDEVADLLCNSSAQNCLLACFDVTFPISPFNLFLLHMASLVAHSLACAFLFHSPKYQGKGRWWKGQLRGQSQKLWLDGISLLAKVLLEAIFLMVFHSLYSQYPSWLFCPPSASCPQITICIVQNASWKDAFTLFFVGASWVSVALCLIMLYQTVIKILQRTSGPGKSQPDHPGWPNGYYIES
ncbi:gap junction beta-2 protein-like [Sceloporus undulatus]|uniref:gap junction beta-2 protein-like n=1 Tax=Sceloporus undulatus TaxID=8520 RepID=UPI001C4AEA7A|nr:gap junction beta-2 protein-like [Sceloporus undulatus]